MIKQFITVILINITMTSFACSCMNYIGVEEHISSTEIIFSGTVTNVEKCFLDLDDEGKSREVQLYTFKITNAYKGLSRPSIEIITSFGFGSCGDYFEVGYDYLIFADDSEDTKKYTNQYETNICKWNGLVSEKNHYLEKLGNI